MTDYLLLERNSKVARIYLNRPDKHNAFDEHFIAELTATLKELEADSSVRLVVLSATGKSFSAGADLSWMRRMANYSYEENLADAKLLAELMQTLNALSKPVCAIVQGAAFGGGVGLVACCDIVIASEHASFSLSEVKLGLIPAVISPYVVAAIGARAARRYFLSAEKFSAQEAQDLGLVHQVVSADALESALSEMTRTLLSAGPRAQAEAKQLIAYVDDKGIDSSLLIETAQRIARVRASAEAKEGLQAFFDKRKPQWLD